MKEETFFEFVLSYVEGCMWLVIAAALWGLAWGGVTFAFLWVAGPSASVPERAWLGIASGGVVSSGLMLLAIRKWRKR